MLFANATLAFTVATSRTNGIAPQIPPNVEAYGSNILFLDSQTTAALDIPQPDYITTAQTLLAPGESWALTPNILGTVAKYNDSDPIDSEANSSTFMGRCNYSETVSGAYMGMRLHQENYFILMDSPLTDQSFQCIGFPPSPGNYKKIPGYPSCPIFSHYVQLYEITRRPCRASWVITRSGFELVNGSCDGTTLLIEQQLIIKNVTSTFFGSFYMGSLVEFLSPFRISASVQSEWEKSSMATGIAAMVWSRITVLHGATYLVEDNYPPVWTSSNNINFSLADVGLMYPVDDIVEYKRLTLRKSGLLYFGFAIQPLLVFVSLVLMACILHFTPVDKDFGLFSILSGIDRESLDIVNGASLLGRLATKIKLVIRPTRIHQGDAITYRVLPFLSAIKPIVRNGRLAAKIIYH